MVVPSAGNYRGSTIWDVLDSVTPGPGGPGGPVPGPGAEPGASNPDPIIPDYLVPIGNSGWFITPEEPADPTDCERYPRSPWCGGSGIDWQNLLSLSPVSMSAGVSANACEICVAVDSSLFWIALPTNHICYRRKTPDCQPPAPEEQPPEEPPPPGTPAGPWMPVPIPSPPGGPIGRTCATDFRWQQQIPLFWGGVDIATSFTLGLYGMPSSVWYQRYGPEPGSAYEFESYRVAAKGFDQTGTPVTRYLTGSFPTSVSTFEGSAATGPPILAEVQKIDPNCSTLPWPASGSSPPPPPPPPTDCFCMCCNNNSNNNSADLEELLRLVARRLGAWDYPVKTPRWLTTHEQEGTATHQSLTEFNVWLMQQLDALIGEFPVKVEIEDSDPTKEGNQKKSINLPNLAESVAEIYGLAAKTAIDSDLHTSFLMRLASEVMAAKTAALIAQDYASANASFLGYKGNQVKRSVQFAFNPQDQTSIESILKNANYQIVGWRNDDIENVADYLQKLMFSAGLMKSVFFRRRSDIERVVKEIQSFLPDGEPGSDGWKQFLKTLNNPESAFNKDFEVKPDIDEIQ